MLLQLESVNLVDLVKSFHTSIYLQTSASRQPRTSLSKYGADSIHFFNPLLRSVQIFFLPPAARPAQLQMAKALKSNALAPQFVALLEDFVPLLREKKPELFGPCIHHLKTLIFCIVHQPFDELLKKV